MKKISLQDLVQTEMEPLSREQLKNVIGGMISNGGVTTTAPATTTKPCSFKCTCANGLYSIIDCTGSTSAQVLAICEQTCANSVPTPP